MSSNLPLGLAQSLEIALGDKGYDELVAVKGEDLYQTIPELRRLAAMESAVKAGGIRVAFVGNGELHWVKTRPEVRSGTLLYALPPDVAGLLRDAMNALRDVSAAWISQMCDAGQIAGPDHETVAAQAVHQRLQNAIKEHS